MKIKSLLLIGIIIPFFVPAQEPDTTFLSPNLQDYLFETGSFWVYEKADSTHAVDSLVQTALVHDFMPGFYMHGYYYSAAEYYQAYYESKTLNYQTWDQYIGYVIVKEGINWGNHGQYIFLSSYRIGDDSEGAEIIDTLNTFALNNFGFNHVTRMLIMNNIFENNNPTIYYYAKGVGMIRKELYDADTSHLQEVWNIKNWQVNHIATAIQESDYANRISAFPNPANGTIHLSLKQNDLCSNLILYDLTGRIVYESKISDKEMDMDLSLYKNGTYLMVVHGKNGRKGLMINKY